jgi:hypothetical protein
VVSSRFKKTASVIGGAALIAAFGLSLTTTSGANFSASDAGRIDISTGVLTIDLGDDKGSEDFDLDFTNLKPGDVQHQNFYVTNTGSVPANVKIGWSDGTASTYSVDFTKLKVGVSGYSGLESSTTFSTLGLGQLGAGESRAYRFDVGLDSSAGNEWQGVAVGGKLTVTLEQS